MIDAAQAVFFVAAKEQRGAAVGAVVGEQAGRPLVSRKAIRSSQSNRTRTGRPSASGSSSESRAGTQYSRMNLPIGVPGPTRVSSSFSSLFSMLFAFLDFLICALSPGNCRLRIVAMRLPHSLPLPSPRQGSIQRSGLTHPIR